ncbi:hypothetical protein BA062_37985 [Prauserella flavalba]|uniref:Uncharacterized protein n=1 Tax=Prauserella flavalba TaxID=1477506 RepID=A0A318L8R4_9PSEU|nr:hypothetical protein BA062_37985 [Prauserella flavalba]
MLDGAAEVVDGRVGLGDGLLAVPELHAAAIVTTAAVASTPSVRHPPAINTLPVTTTHPPIGRDDQPNIK